jgi:hypothetical protein
MSWRTPAVRALLETPLELWCFLRDRKRYWMLPVVIILLLVGVLVFWLGRTSLAPFAYTLF